MVEAVVYPYIKWYAWLLGWCSFVSSHHVLCIARPRLPLYHIFKAVGLAWLVHPRTKVWWNTSGGDGVLVVHSHVILTQGAAYVYERALLPVYTKSNKILLDLGDKHPELKKIPFYPQKKGVGMCIVIEGWALGSRLL